MGIIKNSITFGSGFNITAEGPIDSRMVVEYISDLTTVWNSDAPAYEGMIVSVIEDGNVYTLIDSDFTDINNWKKQGGGIEIYSSVDELPQDATHGTLATVANYYSEEILIGDKFSVRDIYVGENPDCEPVEEFHFNEITSIPQMEQPFLMMFAQKGVDIMSSDVNIIVIAFAYYDNRIYMTIPKLGGGNEQLDVYIINDDGSLSLNTENISIINEFIKNLGGVVCYGYGNDDAESEGEFLNNPTDEQIEFTDVFLGYDNTHTEIVESYNNDIYFKAHNGWENYNTLNLVNNLTDGGADKALSAEMGKLLDKKISNMVTGSTTDPIKFKGYVNVDTKDGVDEIFDLLSVNEVCFVVPSSKNYGGKTLDEDSYVPWAASTSNERIYLCEDLLEADTSKMSENIVDWISGKVGEIRTYFIIDKDFPYAICPDILLLAKVSVRIKHLLKHIENIPSTLLSMIPDDITMTACVGKVLRWSAGDWLANNIDDLNNLLNPEKPKYDNNFTHKYGYNYDMDQALETGIIGYTTMCSSGLPGGIKENYTVIVNGSTDADPNYRTITQFAYGRTGAATNRVWTRVLFKAVASGYKDDFKPWIEISGKNANEISFNPTYNITSTNVQDAIEEVANKRGSGVEIYSSVDELPQDAQHGTLATVSNVNTEEIEVEGDKFSIRDIYVEENPDCEPIMEINVKPNRFSGSARVVFAPKGYSADTVLSSDTYFTFMGLNVSMKLNGEFSSATVINDNYGSFSLNEEGISIVNEFIKNIGGVVLYGQISLGSGKPERPTEEEFNSLENIFGYDNSYTETIETHINDIYLKETTGWRKINDVKIVDSVDKLDPNAEQGSLASVAVNIIGDVSFSELYQPTSDEVNLKTGVIDTTNLSSVSGISVNSSFDTSVEPVSFQVFLFSKDFDTQGGVGQVMGLMPGGAMIADLSTQGSPNQIELFIPNEDGTITINEENLAIINNLLASTEFVYGGVFMDGEFIDPSYADMFYKTISGVQKIDLYIKDVEGWREFVDEKLKAKVDNLQTIVNNLEDKTDLIVNSVEELPQDAEIGTLASVLDVTLFDHPDAIKSIIPTSEFVPTEDIIYGIPVGPYTPYVSEHVSVSTCSAELETKEGYVLRIHTVMPGPEASLVVSCDITSPNGSNKMVYLVAYDTSGNALMSSIGKGISEFVDLLEHGAIVTGSFSNIAHIFPELIVKKGVKKARVYIKNGLGWEQYSELVDQSVTTEKLADNSVTTEKLSEDILEVIENCPIIVNSVDELPLDSNEGTIASVVMDGIILTSLSSLKYPQYSDPNGGAVSSIHPVKLLPTERITQQTNTQVQFMSRSGSNGSYSTFTINVSSSELVWTLQQGSTTKSGKLVYWEDDKYVVNSADFDFINTELGSYSYMVISPLAPSKDLFVDIDNFLVTPTVGKCTFLYVKNSTSWEEYGKVNKDKVVILENKIEELDFKIDENANIIVNSVDELPEDVPTGTLASVLYKVEKTELLPVSKAYVAGGKVSGLTIVYPETADISDFNTNSSVNSLGLNFSNTNVNRGVIGVAFFSGKNAIIGTDGNGMPSVLVEYDSDGNLKSVNQSLIDSLISRVTTYRTISGGNVLDKYIFVKNISTIYKTDIYVKNDNGWSIYPNTNIVESVYDLPSNADEGVIFSVANKKEILIDIPLESNVKVEKIELVEPEYLFVGVPSYDLVYSFNRTGGGISDIIGVSVVDIGSYVNIHSRTTSGTKYLMAVYDKDAKMFSEYHQDVIDILNNALSSGNYYTNSTYSSYIPAICQFVKVSSEEVISDIYIKDSLGWKKYLDEEISSDNYIVNYIDYLPSSAKTGALAKVLTQEVETSYREFLGKRVATHCKFKHVYNLPMILPIGDVAVFEVYDGTSTKTYRISVEEGGLNEYNAVIYNTIDEKDKYHICGYYNKIGGGGPNSSGFYIDHLKPLFDRNNIIKIVSIYEPDVLDLFFVALKKIRETTLYVKNDEGWRQIKELVDNSVTTEKISNGSVTIDKLSPELQTSMSKVSTFLDASAQSDEIIDTLKEIQEYIESDESGAAAMVESIASTKSDIEQLKQSIVVLTEEKYNDLIKNGTINEETIYIVKFE